MKLARPCASTQVGDRQLSGKLLQMFVGPGHLGDQPPHGDTAPSPCVNCPPGAERTYGRIPRNPGQLRQMFASSHYLLRASLYLVTTSHTDGMIDFSGGLMRSRSLSATPAVTTGDNGLTSGFLTPPPPSGPDRFPPPPPPPHSPGAKSNDRSARRRRTKRRWSGARRPPP
jgi:hypothetical protein